MKRDLCLCGLALATTLVVFLPVLDNGFTNWDDPAYVTESRLITSLSFDHLLQMAREPVRSNYHPLTMLSLALDYRRAGLDPRAYHATNLALHLANTALVFWLVRALGGRTLAATITALFFGIHPMHVESVAWVSARKDVLYGLFFLGGLVTYARYVARRRLGLYALSAGLFMLSLLAKPAAVVFPLVLLLVDLWLKRHDRRRFLLEKVPLLLISLGFGLAALETQAHAVGVVERFGLFERLRFACYGLVIYLWKLFVPVGLAALHRFPEGPPPPTLRLAPLFALSVGLAVALVARRWAVVGFAFLFYLVNVALVLQVVPVGQAIIAERYTYLAYVGPLFALGAGAAATWDRSSRVLRAALALVLAAAACGAGYLAFARCLVWRDSETLWSDVIGKDPRAALAYHSRAAARRAAGREDEALADLEQALALKPDYAEAYNDRGAIRERRGRHLEALADFERATEARPSFAVAYFNKGRAHTALGDTPAALEDYDRALELDPGFAAAYNNRASLYFAAGDFARALDDFERAVRFEPTNEAYEANRSHAALALRGRSASP